MSGDHNMYASGSGDGQRSGWRKRTIMEMAREAGLAGKPMFKDGLEAFAALVRADERNRTWTPEHWTEYERSIAAAEREACAKMFDEVMPLVPFARNDHGGCLICGFTPKLAAKAIRARGQT